MINLDVNMLNKETHVTVVGDIMLDKYWHGQATRISPEAPVPVVNISKTEHRIGGAANVALNIAKLGKKVTLIGLVGKDEEAEIIKTQLKQNGIDFHLLTHPTLPTITKLRVFSHQQLIRLDFEKNFDAIDEEKLINATTTALKQTNILVLSDYNKGTLKCVSILIALANKAGIPVIVDPKGNDFSIYQGASIITPKSHRI